MDELVTDCATRPASSEHRFVPIEVFSAHSAKTGLDPEQHRLPFPATFSNTHKSRSIAGRPSEKQAKGEVHGRESAMVVFDCKTRPYTLRNWACTEQDVPPPSRFRRSTQEGALNTPHHALGDRVVRHRLPLFVAQTRFS